MGGRKRIDRGSKGSADRPLEKWLCHGKGPPEGPSKIIKPVSEDKVVMNPEEEEQEDDKNDE